MGWDFAKELEAWGPAAIRSRSAPDLYRARIYCAHVSRTHYENFTVVSLVLPRRLVRHFHAVYAYCRWADDLADETAGGPQSLELLDWWRSELNACYEGRPRHPVMIALRETIARFRIPREPFLNLLVAFEQDQVLKRYETFEQLLGYCRNSANPVGRLVLYLFESHDETRGALSDEVCTGLQLANFWQDVARDWDIGRVYIPREDCARFGYSEWKFFTPAFAEMMRFEVERTRGYFDRGEPLLSLLPGAARRDVELFITGGRAILDAIEKQRFDVWKLRPEVSKREKLRLMGRAVWRWLRG